MKKVLGKTYIYLILLLMYLPIILLVFFSFQSTHVLKISNIDTPTFKLYVDLFNFNNLDSANIWRAVLNTIVIAISAAFVSTVIGTLGAIGIFYSRKKIRNIINSVANISIVNAEIVTALSLRILYSLLNVNLNFVTLLIGHIVLTIPFVVLNVTPKLAQMDANEYEAALDLGATPTKALFRVILPEIMPGIISGFLLSITLSLDDYIITAYTANPQYSTISTYVYQQMVKSGVPLQLRSLTTIIFVAIAVGVVIYGFVADKNRKAAKHRLENS